MTSSARMHPLGATPAVRAAQLVIALAAAPHLGLLDADETARAGAVLASLSMAAMGGGFGDGDLIIALAVRRRYTGLIEELAAEMVDRIGGPDEFFALLDLSTTLNDWIGCTE
ncbi:hypothetical protein ACEN9F_30455 [Duganella sp. CT11-25]|uniref:hypothetical protein n=1 Tax=unclassified Duganella TaxID=2636909 RepID=UPI0039B0014F